MRTTVVIIGAGHAGLAMSRRLTERSIDHVLLERGEAGNSWRTERWDSMRLLTPNWQTTLPGARYRGRHPDGYMSAGDVAGFVSDYARSINAPVQASTTVTQVTSRGDGYEVVTNRGCWSCSALVIATGPGGLPRVPGLAGNVPAEIAVHTTSTYRSPDRLGPGKVLVVGASATGVQLAEEIHRSGRPVTLAVGEHVRLPRTYRGRDIFWWTDATGTLDERYDELDDIVRARGLPSPQLIGSPDRRSIGINSLADEGIEIVGRLGRVVDGVAQFSGSLTNTCALADLKMNRLLARLDEWALRTMAEVDRPQRPPPTRTSRPLLEIDLRRAGFTTVLFATGYRPDYSWLGLPVLDRHGRIVHDGGVVTDAPGVFRRRPQSASPAPFQLHQRSSRGQRRHRRAGRRPSRHLGTTALVTSRRESVRRSANEAR